MAHPLITQWLDRLGLKSTQELQPDEQVVYDRWQRILSEGEVTLESLSKFCASQKVQIETQWKDAKLSTETRTRLIDQHIVYSTLLEAITAPRFERENLEKYLQAQIASKP